MTKILLVEDDKSLREIYGVRLLAEGYDIVSAGDGEEALAMAIKEKPTLIISDVMMPKISGFDMLDILRSTTETRDIKVIMMTALSSDDQRNRGEQLGADRYLVKSQVGIEDVVRTVHEVLEDATAEPAPAAEPVATAEPAAPATTDDSAAAIVAADSTTPATPPAEPVTPAEPTAPLASPGNDDAGPLPPQPSESMLPQPTAPFTSPRPTNLGERVIQPLANNDDTTSVTAEEIARELQASAEPVASQVDEAISDAEVANDTTPANELAPAAPVNDLSSPVAPVEPAPATSFDAPAPAVAPDAYGAGTVPSATDPFAQPQQPTGDTFQQPPVGPATPPAGGPSQPQQ